MVSSDPPGAAERAFWQERLDFLLRLQRDMVEAKGQDKFKASTAEAISEAARHLKRRPDDYHR